MTLDAKAYATQLIADINRRAQRDPDFREALLVDPLSALRAAGVQLADGTRLRVGGAGMDVLRVAPEPLEGELDDAQLEVVSAGVRTVVYTRDPPPP